MAVSDVIVVKDWCGWLDIILVFLSGVLGGAIAILVIMIGSAFATAYADTNLSEQPTSTTYLYALQDNSTASGSFFLGSGNIDGEQKYVYMAKTKNGYRMGSIPAEDCYINESADKPKIEQYKNGYKSKFFRNNLFFLGDDSYKIYIPKGSIKYNFEVDLK